MYSDWVGPAVAGFLAVWLGLLSFLIWQQRQFLRSLFPKSGERDIRKKFEEVIKAVEGFKTELTQLGGKVSGVQRQGLKHIQRVEFMRFNPYDDTGGDQSFTVALLDDQGSGFVLTSLHARSGTRIFAKPVKEGRNSKYQLSKEEELVIKKAMEQ